MHDSDEEIPFGEMSIEQLKAKLRKRGAKIRGRKAELIERYGY